MAEAKRALRKQALALRRQLHDPAAADAARDNLLRILDRDIALPPEAAVSGYIAMRGELDPLPALLALEARGLRVALPYTAGKGLPLRFLAAPGAVATGQDFFGIAAPPESAPACDPDILLVPLAAFDRRGYRLGYGGGFYDAALTRLRAAKPVVAIGWAYAAQEVAAVPTEPHDARLDWIVTEREALYITTELSSSD